MRGSIMLLCLVFMAALSVAALAALQSAWTAQAMISAYLAHHRALVDLEQSLLQAEQLVWTYWSDTTALPDSDYLQTRLGDTAIVSLRSAQPQDVDSDTLACIPLFELSLQSAPDGTEFSAHRGKAAVRVRWSECCVAADNCADEQHKQNVREWSREPWSAMSVD